MLDGRPPRRQAIGVANFRDDPMYQRASCGRSMPSCATEGLRPHRRPRPHVLALAGTGRGLAATAACRTWRRSWTATSRAFPPAPHPPLPRAWPRSGSAEDGLHELGSRSAAAAAVHQKPATRAPRRRTLAVSCGLGRAPAALW